MKTFLSFPVSGPFLPDVPGFQVPTVSVFPPQLRSSSRAPLHLHFCNCSDVFCFISSFKSHLCMQQNTTFDGRFRKLLCSWICHILNCNHVSTWLTDPGKLHITELPPSYLVVLLCRTVRPCSSWICCCTRVSLIPALLTRGQ